MHPHRDMEIITWVLAGAISHQDSIGHRSVIRPGQIQRMSAGTGITHSEHNREPVQTHMLQIWIVPARTGNPPSYQEGAVDIRSGSSGFCLAAAPEGQGGIVSIAQDARLWVGQLGAANSSALEFEPNRHIYLHLARGRASVNGIEISAGDALKIADERRLDIRPGPDAELLVFDLP
jgi:redox-sensitive bicupin YhaK (pirin superfamily)